MTEKQGARAPVAFFALSAFDETALIKITKNACQSGRRGVQLLAQTCHRLARLEPDCDQNACGKRWKVKIVRDFARRLHQGALSGEKQRDSVIQFLIAEKKSRIEAGRICPYLVDIHHGDLRMPVN